MEDALIMLEEVDVTSEGRRYLQYWFTDIGGLCGKMLPTVMSEGTIYALVPEGTPHVRSIELRAGGINDCDLDSRWLYPYVESFLLRSSADIFVAQDIWADAREYDPTCPFQYKSKVDGSIYYCVSNPRPTAALLAEVSRRTVSFVVAMFLVSSDRCPFATADRDNVADQLVDELETVEEIIVQAFDDESYVIWRRTPLATG